MAVEVDRQEYLFLPRAVLREPLEPLPGYVDDEYLWNLIFKKGPRNEHTDRVVFAPPELPIEDPEPTPPFRYNALHDLESLWWIGVYFVFKKQVVDTSKDDVEAQALPVTMEQRIAAAKLLHNLEDRYFTICVEMDFASWIKTVPPILRSHAERLHTLRIVLTKAYRKAEADLSSLELDSAIHSNFILLLRSMASKNLGHLRLRPFPPMYPEDEPLKPVAPDPVVLGTKRSFAEVADDHQASERKSPKLAKTAGTGTRSKRAKPVGRTRPYLPRNTKTQHVPTN